MENRMAKSMSYIMELRELLGEGHPKVQAELAELRAKGIDTGAVTEIKTANYSNAPVLNLKAGNDARRICRRANGTVLRGSAARKRLEQGLQMRD
jgi:hypothetical protein